MYFKTQDLCHNFNTVKLILCDVNNVAAGTFQNNFFDFKF